MPKKCIQIGLLIFISLVQINFLSAQQQKPNILIIMVDQQSADAMSCVMGKKYIHTPNIDKLAEQGIRFTKAYSPNPLCMPMRTCMMTGRFPHETGVLVNLKANEGIDLSNYIFMGKIFREAGYETAYFGKWHVALPVNRKEIHGFEEFDGKSILDAKAAADFIKGNHQKPYFAIASFLSPHEICQWARKEELPGGPIAETPPLEEMPPLKTNFSAPQNETDIMTYLRRSYQSSTMFPLSDYTNVDYRRLQWGYYRLIERADSFVGEILHALEESGQEKNTLVVFLSDHGECAGSHHFNQKTVFYDEASRVPFILKWDGKTIKGTSDILLNTGIDLFPTLCEFSGIETPFGLPGKSIMAPAIGTTSDWKRDYIISENHFVQGEPVDGVSIKPQGRMVRSERYKYCIYSEGKDRESLVDMQFDPQEMVNQAKNDVYKKILKQHRDYLREHAQQYSDEMALKMLDDLK